MYESPQEWAAAWAAYDYKTYQQALTYLSPGQTILDIGAGDLRFARMAAALRCTVIAVENQRHIAYSSGKIPEDIQLHIADAREFTFPRGVDAAVLLMRHCLDYKLYVGKLRAVNCPVLITNARWGFAPEKIDLSAGVPFDAHQIGWYACVTCGSVGFIEGDTNQLSQEVIEAVVDVAFCPDCTT